MPVPNVTNVVSGCDRQQALGRCPSRRGPLGHRRYRPCCDPMRAQPSAAPAASRKRDYGGEPRQRRQSGIQATHPYVRGSESGAPHARANVFDSTERFYKGVRGRSTTGCISAVEFEKRVGLAQPTVHETDSRPVAAGSSRVIQVGEFPMVQAFDRG